MLNKNSNKSKKILNIFLLIILTSSIFCVYFLVIVLIQSLNTNTFVKTLFIIGFSLNLTNVFTIVQKLLDIDIVKYTWSKIDNTNPKKRNDKK